MLVQCNGKYKTSGIRKYDHLTTEKNITAITVEIEISELKTFFAFI